MFGKASSSAVEEKAEHPIDVPAHNTYHPGSDDALPYGNDTSVFNHVLRAICLLRDTQQYPAQEVHAQNLISRPPRAVNFLANPSYAVRLCHRVRVHVDFPGPSTELCRFTRDEVCARSSRLRSKMGLIVDRFFLGLFETGMFPGCFYLLSMWYRRDEAQKRYSLFFSSTSLAGAFGGLLASAIGKMDGIRGYHGWRWIFILEGTLTAVVGLIFLFTFPSFPEQALWLKEDEREYVKARLRADQGHSAAERKISLRDVGAVLKDYRVILGGFMYFGLIVPAYGYAFFAPTIIATYKYNAIQTQLRSVPPWAASFVFSLVIAAISDRFKHRYLFTLIPMLISFAGFGILLNVHNNLDLQYGALFLVVMGVYGSMPITVCWFNMNLAGHHRRSIGTAWQIGFGNIGGIIATYAFDDPPYFKKGYSIGVAFTALSAASCAAYLAAIMVENKRRAKAVRNVGLSEYEKGELGDLNPETRYMY
ncbi:hypothetical protein PG993_001891 [Apiospora rasikravindrae]|uniref:Uncharacterized protein n=1 Tax=Apiospora rasikravindrae TaxID=990691 RepID=A0ABR1UCQ5_9PEZI